MWIKNTDVHQGGTYSRRYYKVCLLVYDDYWL